MYIFSVRLLPSFLALSVADFISDALAKKVTGFFLSLIGGLPAFLIMSQS